jgi:hypothetical protein
VPDAGHAHDSACVRSVHLFPCLARLSVDLEYLSPRQPRGHSVDDVGYIGAAVRMDPHLPTSPVESPNIGAFHIRAGSPALISALELPEINSGRAGCLRWPSHALNRRAITTSRPGTGALLPLRRFMRERPVPARGASSRHSRRAAWTAGVTRTTSGAERPRHRDDPRGRHPLPRLVVGDRSSSPVTSRIPRRTTKALVVFWRPRVQPGHQPRAHIRHPEPARGIPQRQGLPLGPVRAARDAAQGFVYEVQPARPRSTRKTRTHAPATRTTPKPSSLSVASASRKSAFRATAGIGRVHRLMAASVTRIKRKPESCHRGNRHSGCQLLGLDREGTQRVRSQHQWGATQGIYA